MRRSPCFRNFLFQTVWLFCLLPASLPLYAAVTPQNDRAKMYHAEEWEGTITLTNHDNFSQKDDATNIIYKLSTNRSLTFHVRLNERKRFVFDAKHESAAWNSDASQSSGHGDAKDVYTEIVDGESSHETLSAKYDGPVPSKWIWFAIQPQTNQYSLTVNTLYADAVIDNGYEKTVDKDGFATPLAEIEDEPLPTTGTTLNGTKVITYEYTEPTNHGLTNKIRYTVTWSLHPAGPPPELVIDKESFKNYVPGDDTGYVRIFSKKPDSSPAAVRVFLSGVSTQPGTCMNSKTSDTNPDLEFDTSANTAFNAPTKKGDEWMMETKEEVREVKVAIRSHDYGAYGKLRAEAKIKGEWTPIKIAGTEQTSINYPLDENNNKIADAWERQEGIYGAGHAANWDEENTPVLNGKQPGDGLTLYEEYRGIMAQGKHRRLSGARKDLVVENHVTQAASGIALFAKATGLNVITVNSGELLPKPGNANDSTIINLRHGDKDVHVGLQHGIRIVSGATEGRSAGVVGGETVPRKEGAKVTHYPGEVMEIRLSSAIEKNIADFGIAAVNCDVAHELGHALGAQHHGDAAAPLVERDLGSTYVPPKFTVYGADGVLYTTRPLHVGGAIGTLGNEMSGDTRCIMAYNGVFSWAVHADGGNFTFFNVGITSPGTLFCSSPIGTGINAPNHQPAPLFGNAAADRGNCLGKMTVRDYPAQ